MKRLENKVALITGGTSGIGLATAKEMIDEGAVVIITGRKKETLDETISLLGHSSRGIVSDAGSMDDVSVLRQKVLQCSSGIDILFVNAGYGRFAPVEGVTPADFDELFNMLVKGVYFTVQQILPLMGEGSSIILNTSVVTVYGSKYASVYSAAKSAVKSMVSTFAAELTDRKIRVNGISPGYTETDGFSKTGMLPEQIAGVKKQIADILPYKRFADATEIARAVVFLGSEGASYIHASHITADGGFSAIR